MKGAATVYVFDFDGVLCDIGVFKIDDRVRDLLARLLQSGAYCAINTGRAYDHLYGKRACFGTYPIRLDP